MGRGKREFRDFYDQSLAPLCRHLQALGLRQDEDLEDVVQSTYLEAHKTFDGIKDPQAALAWLFTIGRRQYARYVALRVRQRRLFGDALPEQENAPRAPADDERVIASGLVGQVLAMMDQVEDATRRLALQLFFLEDCSLKEIAARTATNVSTLTTWISRFRQQVQARFGTMDEAEAPRLAREVLS